MRFDHGPYQQTQTPVLLALPEQLTHLVDLVFKRLLLVGPGHNPRVSPSNARKEDRESSAKGKLTLTRREYPSECEQCPAGAEAYAPDQ